MIKIRLIPGMVIAVLFSMFSVASASNPVIIATSPPQNGLNALIATSIEVEFDVDMAEASFTNSNFTVNAMYSGRHTGTFAYNASSRTVTFTSDRGYQVSEVVTVVLTTGIQSLGGESLALSYSWSFTVEVTREHGIFASAVLYEHSGGIFLVPGDFDNDGDIDIATTAEGNQGVKIFVNSGYGTFTSSTFGFADTIGAVNMAADFNNDGYLDLFTDIGGVLLNTGNGSFVLDSIYRVSMAFLGIPSTGDFDGDGTQDVAFILQATEHYDPDSVSVMLNLGDGTFAPVVAYEIEFLKGNINAADFDGDGDLDLAAISNGDIAVLANNGDGSFAETAEIYPSADERLWTITTGDIDADGDVDIISGNTDLSDNSGSISIFVNDGTGQFVDDPDVCFTQDGIGQLQAVDFDSDGSLDIGATRSHPWNRGNTLVAILIRNNDGGGFTLHADYTIGDGMSWCYWLADFNNDGSLDVAWIDIFAKGLFILLNQNIASGCGDTNGDGFANVGDAVYLINYVFKGGPAPEPDEAGDANCDGGVNVGDAVYLINYIFRNGPAPCADCD